MTSWSVPSEVLLGTTISPEREKMICRSPSGPIQPQRHTAADASPASLIAIRTIHAQAIIACFIARPILPMLAV